MREPDDRGRAPHLRVLEVAKGTRVEGPEHQVLLCSRHGESSWLAHYTGLGPDYLVGRAFLTHQQRQAIELGGEEVSCSRFGGLEPGYYEACGLLEREGVLEYVLVYFHFSPEHGFRLDEREPIQEQMRRSFGSSFGDVRALAAEQEWTLARRAAQWIAGEGEREAAAAYIVRAREQLERGLPALSGREEDVARAQTIRERALATLRRAQSPSPQALELARGWLLEQTESEFWFAHEERMLSADAVWELYLQLTEL